MDYSKLLEKYPPTVSAADAAEIVAHAKVSLARNLNTEVSKFCFSALDLTTLSVADSEQSVAAFVERAVSVPVRFPGMPHVASLCVYPSFVDVVGLGVEGSPVAVTSVAGGFPASQTFLEVKMLEVAMAVENGADEIDVVMNVGNVLEAQYDRAANEIEMLRQEVGDELVLKVIIESGMYADSEQLYRAAVLAILSGADFVKTSTGKAPCGGATPEAVAVMCCALRDHYRMTRQRIGIKIAGGVRTCEDAALYYTIVEEVLGHEWLTPSLFRIGASAPLADDLIASVTGVENARL